MTYYCCSTTPPELSREAERQGLPRRWTVGGGVRRLLPGREKRDDLHDDLLVQVLLAALHGVAALALEAGPRR